MLALGNSESHFHLREEKTVKRLLLVGVLAVALTLVVAMPALADKPLPLRSIWFGEVSLSGEIRPVAHSSLRLREAAKLGFDAGCGPAEGGQDVAKLRYSGLSGLSGLVDRVMANP